MIANTAQPLHSPYRSRAVVPVPALQDNYIWRIGAGPAFVVVDPGQAQPVLDSLQASGGSLAAILVTHHHHDHVDGIPELVARWPSARVIGPADCAAKGVREAVGHGDVVEIPEAGLSLQVVATPGHTQDHLSYFCPQLPEHSHPALFCGDTLFLAGCGRVFDGTLEQHFDSLGRLSTLPHDTQVYAAHEYTVTNLHFARQAEPDNERIAQRLQDALLLRAQGQSTLPGQLDEELATNPFLRSHLPALARHLPGGALPEGASAFEVFVALRQWRNGFRPPAIN